MLQIIRNMIPSRIRQSVIGDVVRFFRKNDQKHDFVSAPVNHNRDEQRNDSVIEKDIEDEPIEYDVEIRPLQLQDWISRKRQFVLIDIREPNELQHGFCEGSWLIPMNDIPTELLQLPTNKDLIIICAAGVRSWSVSQYLRQQGYDAWSLENGVASWSDHGWMQPSFGQFPLGTRVVIDPSLIDNDDIITDYGFVSMIHESEEGKLYDVRFWGTDEPIVIQNIPENMMDRFSHL